jgi:hypothetical protein
MERGCGNFQRNLWSKISPARNLNKHVLHLAYLDQLENQFNLANELSEVGRRPAHQEKSSGTYASYFYLKKSKEI